MDHSYAEQKLTLLLRDLSQYSADEFRRQMARIMSGATGQDIPDDCHLTKAERNALAKEVDEANDRIGVLTEERDALAAENANLKSDIRQLELIHVGFTNGHQVTYVTEQKLDGSFYPDTDNECYIPLYMLNIHAHRVGPDSEIYKEHCERWKFHKEVAEIRAEAGRAGFVAGRELIIDFVSDGSNTGAYKFHADEYAAKVRQGGE